MYVRYVVMFMKEIQHRKNALFVEFLLRNLQHRALKKLRVFMKGDDTL